MDSFVTKLCLLILVSLTLVLSANGLEGEGIRGGEPAAPGDFGYQVSLEIQGQSICGGGIVGDRWVITAGHCIINKLTMRKRFPMTVVAGVHDIKRKFSPLRVEVDVDAAYVPRRFLTNVPGKHVVGDIAVLKLRQSLDLKENTHLQKLELPKRTKSYTGEKARITGYGWTWVEVEFDDYTGEPIENGGTNGKLRYADALVISGTECSRKYFSVIPETSICAQVVQNRKSDPEGVCSGDSGGPLVHNGKTLIGVVSSSPLGCMEHLRPGIYTRVTAYLDFIRDAMKGQLDSTSVGIKLP